MRRRDFIKGIAGSAPLGRSLRERNRRAHGLTLPPTLKLASRKHLVRDTFDGRGASRTTAGRHPCG